MGGVSLAKHDVTEQALKEAGPSYESMLRPLQSLLRQVMLGCLRSCGLCGMVQGSSDERGQLELNSLRSWEHR